MTVRVQADKPIALLAAVGVLELSGAIHSRSKNTQLTLRMTTSCLRDDPRVFCGDCGVSITFMTNDKGQPVQEPVDEFACRWDDPGLGFFWQPADPILSVRDALAGSLNAMRTSVAAAIG